MRAKLNLMMLLSLLLTLLVSCAKDFNENEGNDPGKNPNEIGSELTLDVFDANATKATEYGVTTTFQNGDKIGLFIIIGDYIQQFNECYTMNAESVWTGEGAYWGDETSEVYYYAYYPYMPNVCFDDIYDAYKAANDDTDLTDPSIYGTGTPDGTLPKWNNVFKFENGGETIDDITGIEKRGTKYYVAPVYDTDDSDGIDARSPEYFFKDIIEKWQPRTYQAGKNYTLSDLMVCRGFFTQTSSNQYPLTLALRHQMSMMHFEFPANLKFNEGLDGKGDHIAIAQPEGYEENYRFPTGSLNDVPAVDEYDEASAGDVVDAGTLPDIGSVDADDPRRATLSVWVDPVKDLGATLIPGIKGIEERLHDLTVDKNSKYYRPDATVTNPETSEDEFVIGSHNVFRYIMRPHDQSVIDQLNSKGHGGYVGAQAHINYKHLELNEDGTTKTDDDGKEIPVNKTFNTNFVAATNNYVHYLMDDGDIPKGDPTTITTKGDNLHAGLSPTCVGAFWRHDQSGERIVAITPTEDNYGTWRAFVYQMDAGWKNRTDIRLSTDDVDNVAYLEDAELHQVTTLSQSVSGVCDEDNTAIKFKIGLTDVDWDMTHPVYGTYMPARYAVVMLIYNDSKKYQLLYLRQGEDPDYLFEKEDSYKSINGSKINRFNASKMSPYNLTAQTWKDAKKVTDAAVMLNATYADAPVDDAATASAFVDYPSQVGGYMIDASTHSSTIRVMWPSNLPETDPGHSAALTWDQKSLEVCPKGYTSADKTHEFDFVRPNAGRTDVAVTSYNGTESQFAQSLFINPIGADNPAMNCIAGYYADGFHDRRGVRTVYYGYDYSSTGLLFYNSRDFASVFLPAGNASFVGVIPFPAVTDPSKETPPCQTNGYYFTTTNSQTADCHYYSYKMTAEIKDVTTASCNYYVDANGWHDYACNIRPFVEAEREAPSVTE